MSEQPALKILLIDDDADVRRALRGHLDNQGHLVRDAANGEEGLRQLDEASVDVVITDMVMPGIGGDEVLRRIRQRWPDTEVVVITAFGDVERAVAAMRDGAFDFFSKPFEVHAISACLQRTARFQALRRERDGMRRRLHAINERERGRYGVDNLIGDSDAMVAVREQVRQAADAHDTNVLVTGETGTGKELVARAIHTESERADGPFVAVDCTAIARSLAEGELFGHVRGAFTDARSDRAGLIEQADGGTLFLDEIGDMEPAVQPRLLRVLEERCVRRLGDDHERWVDIRVVAATNQDLQQAAELGRFRNDLLFRLNTYEIAVPPLRDRRQDVVPLATRLLGQFSHDLRKPMDGFSPGALEALLAYPYPGNVRELRNIVEQAAIRARGSTVEANVLGLRPLSVAQVGHPAAPSDTEDLNLERAEYHLLRQALNRAQGNRTRAADLLGLSRDSLRRRLRRHGLDDDPVD